MKPQEDCLSQAPGAKEEPEFSTGPRWCCLPVVEPRTLPWLQ